MYLLIYQQANEEWNAAVMRNEHVVHQSPLIDVLGRTLPDFGGFKFYDGIEKGQATRLANSLRGLSRVKRVELAEELAKQLSIKASSSP